MTDNRLAIDRLMLKWSAHQEELQAVAEECARICIDEGHTDPALLDRLRREFRLEKEG